jgi:hypothetical protein
MMTLKPGLALLMMLLGGGPGPGPGCSSTAECGCLRGNVSACAALAQAEPALAASMRAARSTYEVAAAGGKHSGFLQNVLRQRWGQAQYKKGITSLQNHIEKHQAWINEPSTKLKHWEKLSPEHQRHLLEHWRTEITTAQEQIGILRVLWASL